MSRESKGKKKFRRVFVERHYIAVEWYDILSVSDKDARTKAVNAANKIVPDPRQAANDNGWIADPHVIPIDRPGQFGIDGKDTHDVVELLPNVFGEKK